MGLINKSLLSPIRHKRRTGRPIQFLPVPGAFTAGKALVSMLLN